MAEQDADGTVEDFEHLDMLDVEGATAGGAVVIEHTFIQSEEGQIFRSRDTGREADMPRHIATRSW